MDNNYSDYFKDLDTEHARRYINKIAIIGVDPYVIKIHECSVKVDDYPKTMYPDIVNYLLYSKSAYTQQQLKAYKGLEAYKQATCGWVRSVHTKRCSEKVVILGRVMHSQRVNESCTNTWIITEADGSVLCAHCDCVAGLGETCTHVCAILFFIDLSLRKETEISVTDVKSQWTVPSKLAAPDKVADIEFALPKKCLNDKPLYDRNMKKNKHRGSGLCKSDIENFLSKLKLGDTALHSVVKPFSAEIRKQLDLKDNLSLHRFYKMDYETETLSNLRKFGTELDLSITIEQCKKIEKETNQQANSAAWYKYRAGRITASKFKGVCRTQLEKPSLSLLRSICYPLATRFKTTATVYGCQHEKTALHAYTVEMQKTHQNFGTEAIGLCLNPKYPQFGASPDGLAFCDCCEMGVVEIKCPYCAKDVGIDDLKILKHAGIQKKDEEFKLDHNHAYYYQIQMQLAITGVDYCDFVVWSSKNFVCERILFNQRFWERESAIALKFFNDVIIPEILGKYYTNKSLEDAAASTDWTVFKDAIYPTDDMNFLLCNKNTTSTTTTETKKHTPTATQIADTATYCLCKGPDNGTPMIACCNLHCSVEWFHLFCVGLTAVPDTEWRCPLCTKY